MHRLLGLRRHARRCCPCCSSPRCRCSRRRSRSRPPPPSPRTPRPVHPHVAGPITVATARATQDGSTATVRGYVVGQPTASTTVVPSGFPNDFALALADTPATTDTASMLYVQIPTAFRSA